MTTVQLGFVGQFKANYKNLAQRLSLETQGTFSPDTEDFTKALKQGNYIANVKKNIAVTPTVASMLEAITKSRADASISRIDLISHGTSGFVSLQGNVEVIPSRGGYLHLVNFADDTSGTLLMSRALERGTLEAMAKDDNAKEAFARARSKFTKDAQFHVYTCNAGLLQDAATPLVQLIANAFGAQTFLLCAEMGFRLKESGKWSYHLRYFVTDPATRAQNEKKTDEVDNYRDLDKQTHLDKKTPLIVSATPAKKGK